MAVIPAELTFNGGMPAAAELQRRLLSGETLLADTAYIARLVVEGVPRGDADDRLAFRTAPPAGQPATFSFAVGGCHRNLQGDSLAFDRMVDGAGLVDRVDLGDDLVLADLLLLLSHVFLTASVDVTGRRRLRTPLFVWDP